jgi:cysteine-rich repeat protein
MTTPSPRYQSLRRVASAFAVLLGSASFMATSYYQPFEGDCTNQIDDDEDGQIDFADSDCVPPLSSSCGNGFVESNAGEVCDDFNRSSGDGCRADCRGAEVCGDGVTDLFIGEVCDDGNTTDGDACSSDCSVISATSFASARDINGFNLGAVNTVVYGEDAIVRPSGDASLLVVVASSDVQLCDTIASSTGVDAQGSTITGLEAFFADLTAGRIQLPVAIITAEKPGIPTAFSAPAALQSDGVSLLIDGGFIVGGGAFPLVDTLFSGGLDGSLSLQSITPTDIAGQYDGVQEFDFASDTALNVGLRGTFAGAHCQAVSDGLQAVFGQ